MLRHRLPFFLSFEFEERKKEKETKVSFSFFFEKLIFLQNELAPGSTFLRYEESDDENDVTYFKLKNGKMQVTEFVTVLQGKNGNF